MLQRCYNTSIDLVTSLFKNINHMSRQSSYSGDVAYQYLDTLCNTEDYLNCEIIYPLMQLFNIKATIHNQDMNYYFHNTYRYNYVTKPGYGRLNSSEDQNRGFTYPNGRDFRSYNYQSL